MNAFIERYVEADRETPKVLEFIRRARQKAGKPLEVLDVGCGYGRYLRRLGEAGDKAVGIEMNARTAAANRGEGLECWTPDEFQAQTVKSDRQYDVLLMSHIVEHLTPEELLPFVDRHLDLLRPGGIFIVATPLMSPYFYDDFDHVKPYHPIGFQMVFEARNAQVQYASRNLVKLSDLWFRRSPFKPRFLRSLYFPSFGRKFFFIFGILTALLFHLSLGGIGRKDGWVGVFVKS